MVAGLLLFVVLAVLQLAIALYVRNTLIASASEGPASARAQTPRPVTVQRAPRLSSRPPSVPPLRRTSPPIRQRRQMGSGSSLSQWLRRYRSSDPSGRATDSAQGRAFSEEQVSAASASSPQ